MLRRYIHGVMTHHRYSGKRKRYDTRSKNGSGWEEQQPTSLWQHYEEEGLEALQKKKCYSSCLGNLVQCTIF